MLLGVCRGLKLASGANPSHAHVGQSESKKAPRSAPCSLGYVGDCPSPDGSGLANGRKEHALGLKTCSLKVEKAPPVPRARGGMFHSATLRGAARRPLGSGRLDKESSNLE